MQSKNAVSEKTAVMPELEEWLVSTPLPQEYRLSISEYDGTESQAIELSREEYIKLKLFLGQLRGLTIPAKPEFPSVATIWHEVEPAELESFGLIQSESAAVA